MDPGLAVVWSLLLTVVLSEGKQCISLFEGRVVSVLTDVMYM